MMSPKKASRASEQISTALTKYLTRRRLPSHRRSVTITELATMAVLNNSTSTPNMTSFSAVALDHATAEAQYTGFKFWISESEDHYKPELAQLLYPLFTHLYIKLVAHTPPQPPPSPAARFHKRHLATFLGNPEFKLFIQQLAEVSSAEELERNTTIAVFRASKYSVTLTEKTYHYLVRYLETSESSLLLQVLNQEVEMVIGDPLGAGSRQEVRAGLLGGDVGEDQEEGEERERLMETIRAVREGPPSQPSIALYRVQCEEGLVNCAQVDQGGGVLGLGGGDSVVRLVEVQPPGPGGVRLDVGSSTVRLGCDDDEIPVLSIGEGEVRGLRGHSGPVYGLDWLRDGPLVSVGEDTRVRLWHPESGAGLAVLRGHQYPVWCVRGDQLGAKFVTGSMDRTARLWIPDLAHPVRVYSGHEGSVDCLAWHPNCNYVLSGSEDKTVRMWSHQDGRCVRVFPAGKGGVTALSCSPDGKMAASGGEDRRVRVWDLAMGQVVREMKGHGDTVTCLQWGADSRLLASGGMDGGVRLWDVGVAGEGEALATHQTGPACHVVGMNFTDTNTLVVVTTENS